MSKVTDLDLVKRLAYADGYTQGVKDELRDLMLDIRKLTPPNQDFNNKHTKIHTIALEHLILKHLAQTEEKESN